MLKFCTYYEILEGSKSLKYADISIEEAAWIYLGYVVYDKKMRMRNWEKDDRMGVNYKDTITKFVGMNLCEIVDTEIHGKLEKEVVIFKEQCDDVLEEKFGAKTLDLALERCYELKDYKNDVYNISDTPLEYYLKKNPGLQKSLDKLADLKTDWFNRWSNRTMDQISKNRHLKQSNQIAAFYHFFPERVPQKLTIYRGVKNFYDEYYNDPSNKPYSSWSLEKKQGERFAKYHFTKHAFENPREAQTQTVLQAETSIDDILVFYGGEEAEVIMKNPVKDIKISHKKGW